MHIITSKGIFIERDPQEQEKEVKLKPKLEVIQGGLSSGEPPLITGNWLRDLPMGSVFLIADKYKPKDFMLGMFRLVGKEKRAVALQTVASNEPIYVDPTRFCHQYELFETIAVLNTEDVPEEKQSDRESDKEEGKDE